MDSVKEKIEKNKFNKKLPYIILVLVAFIALSLVYANYLENKNQNILDTYDKVVWTVGERNFDLEIASTNKTRYLGLSKRPHLCLNCGMLFSFPSSSPQSFVMRNMNFPLDIIFISGGEIIKIYHNLEPEGEQPLNVYKSEAAVDFVIEINGGQAKALGIKEGDKINLPEIKNK